MGVRFLSELERGKPTVRLEKVITVLDALGCTLRVEMPWGEAESAEAALAEEAEHRSVAPPGGGQRPAWSSE